MKEKNKKFNVRMRPDVHRALMILAARDQVTMSTYVIRYISEQARKQGIPIK